MSNNGRAITVFHNHDHVHTSGDPSLRVWVDDSGSGHGAERDWLGLRLLLGLFFGGLVPFLRVRRILRDLSRAILPLCPRRCLFLALRQRLLPLPLRRLFLSRFRSVREL